MNGLYIKHPCFSLFFFNLPLSWSNVSFLRFWMCKVYRYLLDFLRLWIFDCFILLFDRLQIVRIVQFNIFVVLGHISASEQCSQQAVCLHVNISASEQCSQQAVCPHVNISEMLLIALIAVQCLYGPVTALFFSHTLQNGI